MMQYSELVLLPTFKERYEHLRFHKAFPIGNPSKFRWLNQKFYQSKEWHDVCRHIILRDNGCDLGVASRPIFGRPCVHHINPLQMIDFEENARLLLDPENLICVSHSTHNAIHFGNDSLVWFEENERKPNDTCPWKEV